MKLGFAHQETRVQLSPVPVNHNTASRPETQRLFRIPIGVSGRTIGVANSTPNLGGEREIALLAKNPPISRKNTSPRGWMRSGAGVNQWGGQFRYPDLRSASRTRTYNIPVNSRMLYH